MRERKESKREGEMGKIERVRDFFDVDLEKEIGAARPLVRGCYCSAAFELAN